MPEDLRNLLSDKLGRVPVEAFNISDDVWVKIIYSFAGAWHNKKINKEHLLKSLTPLYIGRVASFVIETKTCNAMDVEEKIEHLCRIFEDKKDSLINSWIKAS